MTHCIGPDCRAGKRPACDGRALNDTTDEIVHCGCRCHSPRLTSAPNSWGVEYQKEKP